MKKICNILLICLGIAIVITSILIAKKYSQNQQNEYEIVETIEQIKQQENRQSEDITEENKEVEIEYKGYKVLGIIKIPKTNIEYPILEVTNNESLKLSITKFFGQEANQIGNFTMAGHNNLNGTMFGKNKKLEIGDIIEITDTKSITKQYSIYKKYLTDPNDISVIESEEIGTREITLITCSNGNKNRLIIKAREI